MCNGNMQQSGFGEVSVVSADVIKKLRHRKHMLLSTDYWRKHFEKWSGYPVSAATETCVKVMILSSQARVSRNDSTIELKVSATLR